MKDYTSNKGFTLIEMIITIGIIAIAIGVSSLGLSTVYRSNVNAYTSRVINDIKLVQTKEMASNDKNYKLIFTKTSDNYHVAVLVGVAAVPINVLKGYDLPKNMVIKKKIAGNFEDIGDNSFFSSNDLSFEFDASSGRMTEYGAGPYVSGAGTYQISSSSSDQVKEFVVVKENGRVYLNE